MKIMVTGSTGYIGQKLTIRLLNEGHEVHALCRNIPEEEWCNHERIKFFKGNLNDMGSIKKAMEGCDEIYHVAAQVKVWAKDPNSFYKVNVEGTRNIMEAALEMKIPKVVYTSTTATYGPQPGASVKENSERQFDFFNDYEKTKFVAEENIRNYHNKGLHVVLVHPARVYGPGLWTKSNALSYMIKAYVTGNWHIIPCNGQALSSLSFIDDVIDGHISAMHEGISGESYILGGENISLKTFFNLLRSVSKKNYFLINIPYPLLKIFGWEEELMAKWFGKDPLITSQWIKKYQFDMPCTSKKAIQELGYKITPLKEGLAKTLKWLYHEQNIYF